MGSSSKKDNDRAGIDQKVKGQPAQQDERQAEKLLQAEQRAGDFIRALGTGNIRVIAQESGRPVAFNRLNRNMYDPRDPQTGEFFAKITELLTRPGSPPETLANLERLKRDLGIESGAVQISDTAAPSHSFDPFGNPPNSTPSNGKAGPADKGRS